MALHKIKLKYNSVLLTDAIALKKTKLNNIVKQLVCKSTKMVKPD